MSRSAKESRRTAEYFISTKTRKSSRVCDGCKAENVIRFLNREKVHVRSQTLYHERLEKMRRLAVLLA